MFIGHAAGFSLSFRRIVYFSPVSPASREPPRSVPFPRAAAPATKPRRYRVPAAPRAGGDVPGTADPRQRCRDAELWGDTRRGAARMGEPRAVPAAWTGGGTAAPAQDPQPRAAARPTPLQLARGSDKTRRAPRCPRSQCPPSMAARLPPGRDWPCPRAAGDTAVVRML